MRCNIVYTKMEEKRTWNLRKAKKWKSRAKEPADMKRQLILEKKKRTGRSGARTQDRPVTCQICLRIFGCACLRHWAGCLPYYKEKNQPAGNTNWFLKKEAKWTLWGSNPGPSGYLPNLLTHLWLRMPSALSRMLAILQRKEPADMKRQLILEKKKRSGRSGARTQDRPVMSRMLWPTELSVQDVIIFNCYQNCKKGLITPGYSSNLLLHIWLRTPYGVEPDVLTNWAKRPRLFLTNTICLKIFVW